MRAACMGVMLLLGVAAMAAPVAAQPDLSRRTGVTVADAVVPGWQWRQFRVASADGQRHYRVRVALPQRPAPATGFPVAYLLDGNAALMETDAALLTKLAATPHPPVIAFIAHDNDLRIDADTRAFDYTPRRPGGEEAQRDALGGRRNGGADAFLDLIERAIAPQVEVMLPINRSQRALWGHSYGGVFVLHALFARPDAFNVYAAADPSLWWGDGQLLREETNAAASTGPAPSLYLWTGEGGSIPSHAPPPGRDPAAVAAMQRARGSVPANAAEHMAARLRARGRDVHWTPLPGLSHGQTLGASLPLLLEALSGASVADGQAQ
ncbi:Esterase [uncultured Stenotrophomonas sp.]|uniref:Esterase n=1 Tax=uncultured Stenotrophomonas sp. TaxID=165438 RepID=A0A1Y5Q557_9GAMM|nr:Esterase [uncultured Stenotrophomonas sp.]